jgi:geranylgeranyl transferase type-2 subunit beta
VLWLKSCQNEDGGFGGNYGHDSHILSTHYAVLILIGFDRLKEVKLDKIVEYVSGLQK